MQKYDYFLGVDPGVNGAVAVYHQDSSKLEVFKIPTVCVKGSRNQKHIDLSGLRSLLLPYCDGKHSIAFVEDVHAMPKQGVVSMFRFGEAKGILVGMLFGLGFAVEPVTSQSWKRHFGFNKDKNDVLIRARMNFPDLNISDTNEADALYILRYGMWRTLNKWVPTS